MRSRYKLDVEKRKQDLLRSLRILLEKSDEWSNEDLSQLALTTTEFISLHGHYSKRNPNVERIMEIMNNDNSNSTWMFATENEDGYLKVRVRGPWTEKSIADALVRLFYNSVAEDEEYNRIAQMVYERLRNYITP
nr:MAG TPA: hypothetical protein [Caudoviricetes sp.]